MGRGTSIKINRRNKSKISRISAYRVCISSISHAWPTVEYDEKRGQENSDTEVNDRQPRTSNNYDW